MQFRAKKKAGRWLPKSTARFSAKKMKMAFSTLRRVVLELPSHSPIVYRSGKGTYADVTTKISRIDRLPNLLSNGAPLARYAPVLHSNNLYVDL